MIFVGLIQLLVYLHVQQVVSKPGKVSHICCSGSVIIPAILGGGQLCSNTWCCLPFPLNTCWLLANYLLSTAKNVNKGARRKVYVAYKILTEHFLEYCQKLYCCWHARINMLVFLVVELTNHLDCSWNFSTMGLITYIIDSKIFIDTILLHHYIVSYRYRHSNLYTKVQSALFKQQIPLLLWFVCSCSW